MYHLPGRSKRCKWPLERPSVGAVMAVAELAFVVVVVAAMVVAMAFLSMVMPVDILVFITTRAASNAGAPCLLVTTTPLAVRLVTAILRNGGHRRQPP